MKALTLLATLFSLSAFAEPALETTPAFLSLASQRVFDGSFERVVCVEGKTLNVRGADLKSVLFTAPNFSPVKVFQGWGDNKRSRKIEGKSVAFIKVQFPNQGDKTGWIAEYLVSPRSRCAGAAAPVIAPLPAPIDLDAGIRGLNDPACCQFPLKAEPTADFDTNQRKFGARRSGGRRLHAACDLYGAKNNPIVSIAPGIVLRDPYPFYQGTDALEVRHSGGFVVRYGEITKKRVPGVAEGREVKTGQLVGYMGKVGSNCCEPMLHFELYSGAKTGPLNTGGNKFLRRTDLMNPTSFLRRWEASTFRSRR